MTMAGNHEYVIKKQNGKNFTKKTQKPHQPVLAGSLSCSPLALAVCVKECAPEQSPRPPYGNPKYPL